MALPEELFQETFYDKVLHYGLLIGAIFQLIAIAAIVVLPVQPEEEVGEGDSGTRKQEGGDSAGSGEETFVRAYTSSTSGNSKKGGKKARKRK